jgi:hypothetical protein
MRMRLVVLASWSLCFGTTTASSQSPASWIGPGATSNLAARDTSYQQASIDQYCDQRPLASYVQAAMSLYDTMRSEQGLHDWRPAQKY